MILEELKFGIIWYSLFLGSIVIHESTHAYVAFKLGEKGIKKEGLVTLNPFPYLRREIIGTVFAPIISYVKLGFILGWANTPIDLRWAKDYPKKCGVVILAGPVVSLFMLITISVIIYLGFYFGILIKLENTSYSIFIGSSQFYYLPIILSVAFTMNLILLFFSIIPFPSNDGASIFLFVLPNKKARGFLDKSYNNKVRWISNILTAILFILFFKKLHIFIVNLLF